VDQAQFETLVKRMAQLAERAPRRYRWRVYALAALGFAPLAALLIVDLDVVDEPFGREFRGLAAARII